MKQQVKQCKTSEDLEAAKKALLKHIRQCEQKMFKVVRVCGATEQGSKRPEIAAAMLDNEKLYIRSESTQCACVGVFLCGGPLGFAEVLDAQ